MLMSNTCNYKHTFSSRNQWNEFTAVFSYHEYNCYYNGEKLIMNFIKCYAII